MKRKVLVTVACASALVIGLIVAALGGGDGASVAGKSATKAAGSSSASGRSADSATAGTGAEGAEDGATVGGTSSSDASDGSGTSGKKTSSRGSASGAGGSTAPGVNDDDGDSGLPIDLPDELDNDLPDPVQVLCSVSEREAIETTAAGLRASILDEADAAKDGLLDSLGLGSLLGGISPAVQSQLDAIDDAAQNELDEVEALVEEAVATCEAGGDPLTVF